MRRAARIDKGHGEIVKALRKIGCQVFSLARCGDGAPDLLVSFRGGKAPGGFIALLEIKTPGQGRLTKAQELFHSRFPVLVVTSAEEACRLIVEMGRVA